MNFRGGRNIAMKVPPHRWEATVASSGAVRCDAVEPLPPDLEGFWVVSPADVVHLVTRSED